MDLIWKASFSASCFHTAGAILAGRSLVDSSLEKALAEPTAQLAKEIELAGLPREALLARMIELSGSIENNRQLAQQATTKLLGANRVDPSTLDALAGRTADLENAFRQAIPRVADELATRGEPLRQLWQTRGPGLMKSLARLTEANLIPSSAQVVLVYPALGGGGAAHLMSNVVTFEAVLTNPHPTLPETLRLGWLLSQLNMEAPLFGELVPGNRLARLANLAMAPATLAAAAEVEWAAFDRQTLDQALVAWELVDAQDQAERERLGATLFDWWETYCESNPRWSVALAALDRMVF